MDSEHAKDARHTITCSGCRRTFEVAGSAANAQALPAEFTCADCVAPDRYARWDYRAPEPAPKEPAPAMCYAVGMSEWFEAVIEGGFAHIACSEHFVFARYDDDTIPLTNRQEIERRAAIGERPDLVVRIPAAPTTDGERPVEAHLARFTCTIDAYERARPKAVLPLEMQCMFNGAPAVLRVTCR